VGRCGGEKSQKYRYEVPVTLKVDRARRRAVPSITSVPGEVPDNNSNDNDDDDGGGGDDDDDDDDDDEMMMMVMLIV